VVRDDRQREEICRIINRETVRLRRLVDQLRQVARLEAGTEPMDLQPTKLATLVSNTIEVLRGDRERSGVTIHHQVSGDLPLVLADGDRLTQVLLNLLDNAERHTPPEGHIDVTAHLAGGWVWVTVADSGCGIPGEDVSRIFDRFWRADASRARTTGGSGLGLAIVKGIVEAHGGQVHAESELDSGTRISFCLRVAPQPALQEQKEPALVR
jgi:signal transduction histidine kinase